jgi:hypothetical protein
VYINSDGQTLSTCHAIIAATPPISVDTISDRATWSYGYLTMIVVLAPAVMDTQAGAAAGAAFWTRLQMFVWATIYGTGAVFVFDTLWPRKSATD